jgi:hypothetical protein
MVRKLVLFVILLIGGCSFSYGAQQIPMQIINEGAASSGPTYAPARPWYITQDENVFTSSAIPEDYTLVLFDEDGEIVYSDTLLSGSTMFVLPSTLSGDFEIRLVPYDSTYYYRGYISL